MAFSPEEPRVPAAIGALQFTGVDNPGAEPDQLLYEVQILDESGQLFSIKRGNLAPHIDGTSPVSIAQLQALSAWLRTKAVEGFLPQ